MSEVNNNDVLSFMAGMLQVSLDLAKKCPNKEFEIDIKTHVIPEWSRLMKFYKNKIEEKDKNKKEETID
jgi:hypothetical protein